MKTPIKLPPTKEALAGVADVSVKMILRTCPTCGVVHALPTELLATIASEAGVVYCPTGHATPAAAGTPDRRDLLVMLALAISELRQARAELVHTQHASQLAAVTDTEMARRIFAVIRRATLDDGANSVCEFCSKACFGKARYRRHLKDAHAVQIRELPASHFA